MAKQTFTTGQVLTAAQMTSLQQTAMLGGAANAKVASYVLVAADAGDAITMSNASPTTITVNTGLFAAGDIVTIINLGAGACTITAGTATVDTSGSLVLATNQGGVLRFTSASAAIFFQFATPASGDIEGVTAGTGISGGGTSGTVTITNSMATAIDAKGDLVVGTGADTFSKLTVGANGTTLVADSAETTGLKWATPAGATANFSLLNTGGTNLTGGSTVTVSGISGMSTLIVLIQDAGLNTSTGEVRVRLNTDSGSNYTQFGSSQIYDSGSFNPGAFSTLSYSGVSAFYVGRNNSVSAGGGRLCAGLVLTGCNSSGQKMVQSVGTGDGAVAGSQRQDIGVGFYNSSSTISSVSVNADYTFNAGKVYIYGSAV
jgi:hypothetical protein